jgi:hypothetical protein
VVVPLVELEGAGVAIDEEAEVEGEGGEVVEGEEEVTVEEAPPMAAVGPAVVVPACVAAVVVAA